MTDFECADGIHRRPSDTGARHLPAGALASRPARRALAKAGSNTVCSEDARIRSCPGDRGPHGGRRSLGKLGGGRVRLLLLRAPGGALGRRVRSTRARSSRQPAGARTAGARGAVARCGACVRAVGARAVADGAGCDRAHLSVGALDRDGAVRAGWWTAGRVLRPAALCRGARRGDIGRRLTLRRACRAALESARRRQPDRSVSGDSADERCAGRRAVDAGGGTRHRHQAPLECPERSRDERGDSRSSQSRAAGHHDRHVPAAAAGADLGAAVAIRGPLRARVRAWLRDGRADAERLLRIATGLGLWFADGALRAGSRDDERRPLSRMAVVRTHAGDRARAARAVAAGAVG